MVVAGAEFLTRGYEGASMGRIARTAKVSPKTVYARYANKDELLLAVVDTLTSDFRKSTEQDLSKFSDNPKRSLTTFATALARVWTSDSEVGLYRLVITEAVRFPSLSTCFRKSVEVTREILERYLAAQADRGALLIDDPVKGSLQFHALVTSDLRERMLLGERPSSEEVKDTVARAVRLFLDGCRPRSPSDA